MGGLARVSDLWPEFCHRTISGQQLSRPVGRRHCGFTDFDCGVTGAAEILATTRNHAPAQCGGRSRQAHYEGRSDCVDALDNFVRRSFCLGLAGCQSLAEQAQRFQPRRAIFAQSGVSHSASGRASKG